MELIPENKDELPKTNLLKGSDARNVISGGEIFYKFGNITSGNSGNKVGLIYGNNEDNSFIIEDHKEWLALLNNKYQILIYCQLNTIHKFYKL